MCGLRAERKDVTHDTFFFFFGAMTQFIDIKKTKVSEIVLYFVKMKSYFPRCPAYFLN